MTQFIGRFHVLMVHLPIGFFVVLAVLEVSSCSARLKPVLGCRGLILGLTVPVAVLSALCGWLLSLSGDYDGGLLTWHKWTGTSLAVLAVLLWFVTWRGWVAVYRCGLVAALILLAITGHLGGSLTHGSNYLTELAPKPLRHLLGIEGVAGAESLGTASNLMQRPVFAAVIQPILARDCVTCHGPGKAKAKLRLDTLDNLMEGSESGPVIQPGSAADSVLIKRLLRPIADEEHMPPANRRQLLYEEVVLLQWWIDAGAPADKSPAELNPPANVVRILESHGQRSG